MGGIGVLPPPEQKRYKTSGLNLRKVHVFFFHCFFDFLSFFILIVFFICHVVHVFHVCFLSSFYVWRSTNSASCDERDDYCFLLDVKGAVATRHVKCRVAD